MARFLHKYQTLSDFNTDYNGSAYQEPWVSYTTQNEQVDYNKEAVSYDAVFQGCDELDNYPQEYQDLVLGMVNGTITTFSILIKDSNGNDVTVIDENATKTVTPNPVIFGAYTYTWSDGVGYLSYDTSGHLVCAGPEE